MNMFKRPHTYQEYPAYRHPPVTGQRAYKSLRYLLSLAWWSPIFGALIVAALVPISQPIIALLGTILSLAGMGLHVWAVRTLGHYYSGHVETWENQSVIDAGPYRRIRHPGYAGTMLQTIGMPLVVNAYLVLPLSLLVVGLFLRRLLWEEEHLTRSLPGYRDYRDRTSRLIPGVW